MKQQLKTLNQKQDRLIGVVLDVENKQAQDIKRCVIVHSNNIPGTCLQCYTWVVRALAGVLLILV